MKKCAEKVYNDVQVVKIQPEKKHSMDKLAGSRAVGFRRDSGDTSSRLSAGIRMLTKPTSQSVGQTSLQAERHLYS